VVKRKIKKIKMDKLGSIDEQSRESVESVLEKKGRLRWEGFAEKGSFKSGLKKSDGVMDDDNGESMEPMEGLPVR